MTRNGLVRRAILSERLPGFAGLPWAALGLAIAFAIRLAIAPFVQGVPFLTFSPAVLLVSVFLGWRWGVVSLAASAVIANYASQEPAMAWALRPKEIVSSIGFLVAGALIVSVAEALRRTLAELDQAARREVELKLELQHRVNNNLAMVQSLATQSARLEPEPSAFVGAFTARLVALSEANRVLSGAGWEASPLPQLAEAALAPFFQSGQIEISGPPCSLPLNSCIPLALALHELGTNATKYGALSRLAGRVTVRWVVRGSTFLMTWREAGGPPVAPPTRRGMGSRLLQGRGNLNDVKLDFRSDGLICEIAIEGARLADGVPLQAV